MDKTGQAFKILKNLILFVELTVILDILWLIMKFGKFFIGEKNDPESGIKRIIYLIGICGLVMKIFFIYALFSFRKKNSIIEQQNDELI